MPTDLCKQFIVTGRVQGVFYRSKTQKKAKSLGLKGFVRNLPDGCVEIVACGKKEQIDVLSDWLWEGPQFAKVRDIKEKILSFENNYTDFTIQYDE